MKKIIFISLILLSELLFINTFACTTAVISGKATADGRPLLWKHRDTWFLKNKIMMFYDGKYDVAGLVNSVDTLGQSIWIGYNSAGFAIMNSASYNLNNDTITQSGLEGRLMKMALQTCANVEEFEQLLKDMEKPTKLEANFGVIDAKGGAAYFELANFEYFKFDANDPEVAPDGMLIRTNYSFAGEENKGGGYIRYQTADKVFKEALAANNVSFNTMLVDLSRNLTHSLTGIDLCEYQSLPGNNSKMVFFQDFIPRTSTSSSVVVQGIKNNEDVKLTTMWSIVGFPLTSVTIPVWLNNNDQFPEVLRFDETIGDSPMCNLALNLKDKVFPYKSGVRSKYYMDINTIINADTTGYWQVIKKLEDQIVSKGELLLNKWRQEGLDEQAMNDYYQWVDQRIFDFYKENFELNLSQN